MITGPDGNPIDALLCHYSMMNLAMQSPGIAPGDIKVECTPIPVPCQKDKCTNWDSDNNQCGDVTRRQLLEKLLEKSDA